MSKRIGFLWEKMIAEDNCIRAEKNIGKNKPDNRMAKHIAAYAERYGKELYKKLSTDTFEFHENHKSTITDSYKGKTRNLIIPCLEDQAAMQAWLQIATPYIERRNYYYNCGSIPGAGTSRAVNGLQKILYKHKCKYAVVSDIRHFYETCPHWAVIKGLQRIFKDRKFIEFANRIMKNMTDGGDVGLAIGYPVSHWFANVALFELDHAIKEKFPDVYYVRYMDDVVLCGNNKRHVKWAYAFLKESVEKLDMELKGNYQVFEVKKYGISFLSYRFYVGYTLLRKPLMFRIARKMRRAKDHLSVKMARGITSYIGILRLCNSYHFRRDRVYPYVKFKTCRRLVSNEDKNKLRKAA